MFRPGQRPTPKPPFARLRSVTDLRRGQGVGRNDHFSSWVHDIDLRISQELPGLFGKGKAEVWLDVLDIGNPIDKDRGHVEEVLVSGFGRPQGPGVVEYGGIDAAASKCVTASTRRIPGSAATPSAGRAGRCRSACTTASDGPVAVTSTSPAARPGFFPGP
ncbi:MAG: hypothetical protein KY442_09490 [Proteobacteria bacterium]|nr:hypothetical protein [Pseudomonadota bacterium]